MQIILIVVVAFLLLGCSCSCTGMKKESFGKGGQRKKNKLIKKLCECDSQYSDPSQISSCKSTMQWFTVDALKENIKNLKEQGRYSC